MSRVAFLGLGAMGAPMARRILAAGFPLTVWNRNPERARAIEGATIARTPRQAAAAADIVCTMLSDPAALQAVADGEDGLVAGLSSGKIWLDFSTVTPAASRRAAERAREKGADFCDVPVAGSVKPATDGTLKLLAGGDGPVLSRAKGILDAVSAETLHFGGVGQGSAMKLVNNLMYGVTFAAFGEALGLAQSRSEGDSRRRERRSSPFWRRGTGLGDETREQPDVRRHLRGVRRGARPCPIPRPTGGAHARVAPLDSIRPALPQRPDRKS